MTNIDTLCESAKLRLIAAADFLMASKMPAGQIIPVQGKNWIIAIGPREWIVRNVAAGAPTDMSTRLRAAATADVSYADARLLIGAAEEIERYYGGMMAWKRTAEAKDADVRLAATTQASTAQPGDYLPKRDVADEIVLLSNVICRHPQLKPLLGREALLMRCVREALVVQASTAQAERANANLYGDIMNLPCNPPDGWSRIQQTAYTIGHRDARHAAAELVSAQDTTTSSTDAQAAAEVRDAALEEAADALELLNDSAGDAAAYDNRDMDMYEEERMHAVQHCINTIRALRAGDTKGEQADGGGA